MVAGPSLTANGGGVGNCVGVGTDATGADESGAVVAALAVALLEGDLWLCCDRLFLPDPVAMPPSGDDCLISGPSARSSSTIWPGIESFGTWTRTGLPVLGLTTWIMD